MAQFNPQEDEIRDKGTRVVTVPPRNMKRIDLGEYESKAHAPKLSYSYMPNEPDSVGTSPVFVPLPHGGLRLTLHIQNYGDQPITVQVQST